MCLFGISGLHSVILYELCGISLMDLSGISGYFFGVLYRLSGLPSVILSGLLSVVVYEFSLDCLVSILRFSIDSLISTSLALSQLSVFSSVFLFWSLLNGSLWTFWSLLSLRWGLHVHDCISSVCFFFWTQVSSVWILVDSVLFPQLFPSRHSGLPVIVFHRLSGFSFLVLSGLSFVLGAFISDLLYLLN